MYFDYLVHNSNLKSLWNGLSELGIDKNKQKNIILSNHLNDLNRINDSFVNASAGETAVGADILRGFYRNTLKDESIPKLKYKT